MVPLIIVFIPQTLDYNGMQKQNFAAEQRGRGHDGDCRGLYTTLALFTSQMVTRESRRGLRKFLASDREDIHNTSLFARYVLAPVNHIVLTNTASLKKKEKIPVEAAVSLKLYWLTRAMLVKRMSGVLAEHGWQPAWKHHSVEQRDCVAWVVGRTSPWGLKYPKTGVRGITQLVFQAYAHSMAKERLFRTFLQSEDKLMDGRGIMKKDTDETAFIADDYGLAKENDFRSYMGRVLLGTKDIGPPYIMSAFKRSLLPPAKRKRGPSNKETDPSEVRRSKRGSTKAGKYTENSDEEDDPSDNDTETKKKVKTCSCCTDLATAFQDLESKSDQLTAEKIVRKVQKLVNKHVPGLGSIVLLATDDESTDSDED